MTREASRSWRAARRAGRLALALAVLSCLLLVAVRATAKPHAVGPELVLSVPWGAMGATVGKLDGDEGASEGPMSFEVAPNGDVVVLDQVNARLARFDPQGVLVDAVPLPARTFQEMALMADGSVLLLDRLARRSLLQIDAAGNVLREDGIIGPGVREGGMVTALLPAPDGIWLEVGHAERVRLLDEQLLPTGHTVLPGRPFSSSRHLLAALDTTGGAVLWLEDAFNGNALARATIQPSHRIDRIIWVERDGKGAVHAIFHQLELDPADPTQILFEGVLGQRYDASLKLVASYTSPYVIQIWEQFRELRIASDGTVYQMAFDAAGMRIFRFRWAP